MLPLFIILNYNDMKHAMHKIRLLLMIKGMMKNDTGGPDRKTSFTGCEDVLVVSKLNYRNLN